MQERILIEEPLISRIGYWALPSMLGVAALYAVVAGLTNPEHVVKEIAGGLWILPLLVAMVWFIRHRVRRIAVDPAGDFVFVCFYSRVRVAPRQVRSLASSFLLKGWLVRYDSGFLVIPRQIGDITPFSKALAKENPGARIDV